MVPIACMPSLIPRQDGWNLFARTLPFASAFPETGCAVKGGGPQRELNPPGTGSLHPVAIEAAAEATKLLKPSV